MNDATYRRSELRIKTNFFLTTRIAYDYTVMTVVCKAKLLATKFRANLRSFYERCIHGVTFTTVKVIMQSPVENILLACYSPAFLTGTVL